MMENYVKHDKIAVMRSLQGYLGSVYSDERRVACGMITSHMNGRYSAEADWCMNSD